MPSPTNHNLNGKQTLAAFVICVVIISALLGPSVYREVKDSIQPHDWIFLLVSIAGGIIGFIIISLIMRFVGAFLLVPVIAFVVNVLPKRFTSWAVECRPHFVVVILIFGGLFTALLLIFRNFIGVVGGLLAVGMLLGLPVLLGKLEQKMWRVIIRRKKTGKITESEQRKTNPHDPANK